MDMYSKKRFEIMVNNNLNDGTAMKYCLIMFVK